MHISRRAHILIASILCFSYSSFSQNNLVKTEELVFHTSFEKEAFSRLINHNQSNYFELFMAVNQEVSPELFQSRYAMYHSKIEEINLRRFEKKKPEKKIKILYKKLHEAFLKKYELNNTFSSVFQNGLYNCVSATALYAMALEDLRISYTIRETPTHVYLVAYPQTFRVLIETTDPTGGYYVFNEKFKSNFVGQMRKRKLISDQEYTSRTTNELFDEHFFTDENISLKELLGIQYYNDALFSLDEQRYEYACQQLEKAYYLYPSERIAHLLLGTTALTLEQYEHSNPKYIDYLVKLSRFKDYDLSQEDISGEFSKFTISQLTNQFNIIYYDSMFQKLTKKIADSTLMNEISHIYFQQKGRVMYNKGQYTEALSLIEEAFSLKPDNADNQMMLTSAIAQKLNTIPDNLSRIEFIKTYTYKYPPVAENSMLQGSLLQLYLMQFAQAYDLNKEKDANYYRQLFEEAMNNNSKDLPINTELIGRAYSLAAVYYFKKGNNTKTRNLLNKGLEYAPNNFELLQRKRLLNY